MKITFQLLSALWLLISLFYFWNGEVDKAIYSILFCLVNIGMVINESIEERNKK